MADLGIGQNPMVGFDVVFMTASMKAYLVLLTLRSEQSWKILCHFGPQIDPSPHTLEL